MERQFKGVWIPSRIWLDHRLTAVEKMLLAEIDSFTGNGSTYFKSNETIAEDMGTSVSTIRRAIRSLKELGLVREASFDGRRRHLISAEHPEVSNVTMEGVQFEQAGWSNEPRQEAQNGQLIIQDKNNKEVRNEIVWPEGWDAAVMIKAWEAWKEYKSKEWKFKYRSLKTEQVTIDKLHHETNGDLAHAVDAITRSIAKNWRGIFPAERSTKRDAPTDPSRALAWANK